MSALNDQAMAKLGELYSWTIPFKSISRFITLN